LLKKNRKSILKTEKKMIAENTALELFGTKEVSVKEFMGSSDKSLVLLSDYEKAKENLEELKTKYEARVEELVSIDKLSPEENKELNSIRAELREPRYLIQNIEKNNISVFEAYKKTDKANLKSLIEINVSLEDKATSKLQAEEQRKREEKEAEAKAEELRVERIKTQIDNIETYCYEVIQKMNFENLKISTDIIEKTLNAENDFEEYDLLLDQVKERVAKQLLDKTNDITARENQRLENEAMKQEIFQVRVNRLKEVGFELFNDLFKSNEFDYSIVKADIFNIDSGAFENVLLGIKESKEKAEQIKRNAEIKKEKDEQFVIRKNRLAEIGLYFTNTKFVHAEECIELLKDYVYNATIFEFEQILLDSKKVISDAKAKYEADLKAKEEANKKAHADLKKKEAENKARVKRLAKDKATILKSFEVYFSDLHLETENEETKHFISFANLQIKQLKADLLTQLNEM
jgi:hypothetical protein